MRKAVCMLLARGASVLSGAKAAYRPSGRDDPSPPRPFRTPTVKATSMLFSLSLLSLDYVSKLFCRGLQLSLSLSDHQLLNLVGVCCKLRCQWNVGDRKESREANTQEKHRCGRVVVSSGAVDAVRKWQENIVVTNAC